MLRIRRAKIKEDKRVENEWNEEVKGWQSFEKLIIKIMVKRYFNF